MNRLWFWCLPLTCAETAREAGVYIIMTLFRITQGICLSAVLLLAVVLAAPANAKYASYVVDADTGEVLHAINEETRNYPASLTKMMTLYMMFERLEQKKWTLNTKLRVSKRAAAQPASKLGLRAGSTITVKQAILALVTKSANDVAMVVAESIAERERTFALRMTAKARKIGMSRTTFRNASGLPHRGQLSTAKDMSILARALLRDFPQYYHYFSTTNFRFNDRNHRNHNKLLKTYNGMDGLKTGYIRASGFNLAASATRDGRRLIGVVFGGNSSNHRNKIMTRILDRSFAKLKQNSAPALIASRESAPVAARTPSAAPTSGASRAVWAVQVGAFSRQAQAQRAARVALQKAPNYLRHGQVRIVPLVKRNGTTLHRARIVGISKRDAYRSCRILKDCMELSARVPAELASTAN